MMVENSMRNVLVIGGAGYVGNVLVRRLLANGYRVTVLDALLYPTANTLADLLDVPGFRFVKGDLRDAATVSACMKDATDVVLLAGLVGDPITKKYPELATAINLHGCRQVFDLANGQGIDRFVFTSTCSNYGVLEGLATETSPLNPKSLYAEHKVAIEEHLMGNADKVDFAPVALRISTAFGLSPRMRFDLSVSDFTRALAAQGELLVYDADTWRPYCHVLDIAKAVITCLECPADKMRGQVFNVGSESQNYTKRMLVETIAEKLGGGTLSYHQGGVDPRDYRVSFDKIESQLGYKADQSVADSIGRLVEALRVGMFTDFEARRDFYGNYVIEQA